MTTQTWLELWLLSVCTSFQHGIPDDFKSKVKVAMNYSCIKCRTFFMEFSHGGWNEFRVEEKWRIRTKTNPEKISKITEIHAKFLGHEVAVEVVTVIQANGR